MRKSNIRLLRIIFIGFIIFVVVFLIYKSTSSTVSGECSPLQVSNTIRYNILFVASDVQAKEYMDYLLSTYPYSQFKDKFSFYTSNISAQCEIYKDVALLCYNDELIAAKRKCKSDYIITLVNNIPHEIRSSSYRNFISINTQYPKTVLTHEMGHAFAGFDEEYVPGKRSNLGINCVDTCDKFYGLNEGCYQGCSEEGLKRSVDNGVMRTLQTNSYGNFNDQVIIDIIVHNKIVQQTAFEQDIIYTDIPDENLELSGEKLIKN